MPDFVAGPVARRKKNKTKFLVMWTATILKGGRVSPEQKLKFAGGMALPQEIGDIRATYTRELKEEVGLILAPEAPLEHLVTVRHAGHEKKFVLSWRRDCCGSLRTTPIPDDDYQTMLYVPFFAEKAFLDEHLYGDHREVLPYLLF